MNSFLKNACLAAILVISVLFTGCGGGGSSNTNNTGVTMSVGPLSLSVTATTTDSAPAPTVFVDFTGLTVGQTVYIGAHQSGQGIYQVNNSGGALPAPVQVVLESPGFLGPGTYQGTVQIQGCMDQACTQPVGNSPQIVQVNYTVTQSTYGIMSLSPSFIVAGGPAFMLTVTGLGFSPQSGVFWNGSALTTTFVSSTELQAQVTATEIAVPGNASVSVSDPANGVSNQRNFSVQQPPATAFVAKGLSPASATSGGPAFTLTVTGSSFTLQSVMHWNGNSLPTTYVSSTQLTAQVSAAQIAAPGTASVSVSDPIYGTSNALTFTVKPPPLALNSISPTSLTVGGPSFVLTVLGNGFSPASTVQWNGAALSTTYVSLTELLAQVPATDISAIGTAAVTVNDTTSSVGTTSPQSINIVAPSKDAVAYQINAAHTGAINFNAMSFPTGSAWSVNVGGTPSYALAVDGKVILTVLQASGASQLLALDQTNGSTVWGPIALGGAATAAYDGGRVFVVSGSSNGMLQAYDVNTGALDWSDSLSTFFGFTGLPVAADGVVYWVLGAGLDAFDESTGTQLWVKGVGGGNMTPSVTVDGVFTTYYCETADLRPATGEFIWSHNIGCSGGGGGMPVVANQQDYALGNIFNAETGANEGTYVADVAPAFSATMGYFVHSGTLIGVRLSDSTQQWSFTGDGHLSGAPIAVNQYVFVGSSSGNLYALDGTTGATAWTTTLGSAIDTLAISGVDPFSGLAAGDGLLIVPSGTTVTAYILSTNP